ncbi:signal transduction histidine kinase [Micromonospora vinacea]|uniref:histidine kinase n=1 Tax=Micromonospora vinacea TaxID=709878 RepID=A0ABS0K288_9ACTN|nr:sensor histidine kinase [Micromonospora vinacea]MBG6102084.1 signal transduction histidine kinase [Micromonospora vinacea]
MHPKGAVEGARLPVRPLTHSELVAVDVVVAGLLATVYLTALPRSSTLPDWLHAVLVSLIALPVAVRRVWPMPVFASVALASIVSVSLGILPDPLLAVALTAYTAAAIGGHRSRRSWLVIVSSSAVLTFLAVATGSPQPWPSRFGTLLPGLALVGASWAAGIAVAQRRAYAVWRAEDRVERAVSDERLRIAREVHDIVTHNLGVIAVKAAVTRHLARDRPAETLASLAVIEQVSREALAEMRQALRLLRDSDEPRGPAPGLPDVPALVRRAEKAGLTVRSELPEQDDVPSGVSLTAYRIVQEALTNVIKHVGPTRCSLTIRSTGSELLVEVADDGPVDGRPIRRSAAEGFGLAGMRERVEMHNGDMTAGPLAAGGFQVQVKIPHAPMDGQR